MIQPQILKTKIHNMFTLFLSIQAYLLKNVNVFLIIIVSVLILQTND